ncbi:amidohydrolase family protein [Mesorhizobium sp.]|uniref:amidohydrolase family protein n=1 Tax=Mesorhizobium sp. TaxID=1871066 RepID=UPI00121BBB28|nr:amidohydrolase family protein [Mesorhizobium sp.]TIP18428.1 MAG: amidohydrolase [Mesorhizobium sp.]
MGLFSSALHADRQVLIGRVVTLDAKSTVYGQGAVCIDGDRIAAIAADAGQLPPAFTGVVPIETNGSIYPGLIELHNHLSYNYLPLWSVPRTFTNRNIWRKQEPDYDVCVTLPNKILGSNVDIDYPRAIARFVECRALLGGVTTTQGLSARKNDEKLRYQGLTRNVEAPNDPLFPTADGQTLDYDPPSKIATHLVPALQKDRPFFYHLSEGTDGDARQRYLDLEYESGKWAINRNLITIHCTALRDTDFTRLQEAAGMVWSPLSNLLLYGKTADVAAAKAAGLRIALGSDWSPSGSRNILGELKIARIVSNALGGLFNSEELVRMATSAPAVMLGWDGLVGSIEAGKKADLVVLEGDSGDPYTQLVDASEADILAVVINGRPRHGRIGLLSFDSTKQERFVIDGKDYTIDLTEPGSHPLNGLSLGTAITKLTYGLAHLPELAAAAPSPAAGVFRLIEREALSIDFELDDEDDFRTIQDTIRKAAPTVRPLSMAPITAVDDSGYAATLKANINLPDYVKKAL